MLFRTAKMKPTAWRGILYFGLLNFIMLLSVFFEAKDSPRWGESLFPVLRDILTLNIAAWAASKAILECATVTVAILDEDGTEDTLGLSIPVVITADSNACKILSLAGELSEVKCVDADDPEHPNGTAVTCRLTCGSTLPAKTARCVLILKRIGLGTTPIDMKCIVKLDADVALRSRLQSVSIRIPLRVVI